MYVSGAHGPRNHGGEGAANEISPQPSLELFERPFYLEHNGLKGLSGIYVQKSN